ncbi:hypothetical protein D3C73_1571750 [compost metagenome]
MFAECAAIPTLTGDIGKGINWLCCAVAASGDPLREYNEKPQLNIQAGRLQIISAESVRYLSIP